MWLDSRHTLSEITAMDELICYCFEYTAADIQADYRANGRSTILERIVEEKRAGTCRCAEKNPKGG